MNTELLQILKNLGGALAVTDENCVTWCTAEAEVFGVRVGMPLWELLPPEAAPEMLGQVQQLCLPALREGVYAQVYPMQSDTLLLLHDTQPEISQGALLQTTLALRLPLNDILITGRNLFEQLEEMEDPLIQKQTARMTRCFYQLLRTLGALAASQEDSAGLLPEPTDLGLWLEEQMRPAASALDCVNRRLRLSLPAGELPAHIDQTAFAQALWCLLSNAVRYSPENSVISLQLQKQGSHYLFTLRNQTLAPVQLSDLSGGFQRTPSVDGEGHGMGLGILRAQRIIQQHGGVLLLSCSPAGEFVAAFRIPDRFPEQHLRVEGMQADAAGGYDPMLVEFSDFLPEDAYDSRNL